MLLHSYNKHVSIFDLIFTHWVDFSSEVDLLALLKWKAHPDRVMDILGRLRHVCGEEIVKVRVLFCALFLSCFLQININVLIMYFIIYFFSFFKIFLTHCFPFWMTTRTNMDRWCFNRW